MTIKRFKLIPILTLTLCVGLLTGISISYETLASSKGAISNATKLMRKLDGDLDAKELFDIANAVGPFIDEIRQANPGAAELNKMKNVLTEMRRKTSVRVAAIEASKGDHEGELESLYRSQEWDDMSFALAAFPYWRAWIDLELAYREQNIGIMGA